MSLQQGMRSQSRGSGASSMVRTMVRSAARLQVRDWLSSSKKDQVVAVKAPDAFPWGEASTTDELPAFVDGDADSSDDEWEPLCVRPCHQDEPVLIFDWDDTLLPTSFVEFLGPLPEAKNGQRQPMYEAAERHASRVESLLRAARSLGRVAIVTMANKAWLVRSARRYLPGLDIEELMDELDIPAVYASDYTARFADKPAFEAAVACKSMAFERVLENLGVVKASVDKPANVLSFGDSRIEHKALRSVLDEWSETGRLDRDPLIKTVKFMDKPTMTQLSSELRMLEECLHGMVHSTSGFHVAAADVSEFEEKVWAPFGLHVAADDDKVCKPFTDHSGQDGKMAL